MWRERMLDKHWITDLKTSTIMKTLIKSIFTILILTVTVSCDRSGIYEEFQNDIPWGFCVVTHSDDNKTQPVKGATVEIFLTDAERDAGTTPYLSKVTDEKGEAHFSLAEFNKNNQAPETLKGNYYLKVTKDDVVVKATTRYLLMNSGETYQWVQIQ